MRKLGSLEYGVLKEVLTTYIVNPHLIFLLSSVILCSVDAMFDGTGVKVGCVEGFLLCILEGFSLGLDDDITDGAILGFKVGVKVGFSVGFVLGKVDGASLCLIVGNSLGLCDITLLGIKVGLFVGVNVGCEERVGLFVGACVGD